MEIADSPKLSGCCLFRRRRRRRTSSTSSIPRIAAADDAGTKPGDADAGRPRTGSHVTSIVPVVAPAPPPVVKPVVPPQPNAQAAGIRRPSGNDILAELDGMLYDRQRARVGGNLVRASSGNLMVCGNLGNLRGHSNNFRNPPSLDVKEQSMEAKVKAAAANREMDNDVMVKGPAVAPAPEELKEMGNEEYKNGRFTEALAFYDGAIAMDRGKASYYSNKAAALTAMGRLLEAVGECKEAIRTDPTFYRAHHRLASLYLRLGETEKAINHFKLSRNEATPDDLSRAQALRSHISKSNEARRLKDHLTLLKESTSAASCGADSASQVFALQAEALLKLHRHDEAEAILSGAPKFSSVDSTKFFGAAANAYFLMVQAQVDMATGRFEDAVIGVGRAAQLDPSNREISVVARRMRAVASTRARGNELFRASKFAEACIAYGEGLNHDPHNAILLCNRAACCFKLGRYDRAIEDCSAALALCPSYRKARRRRADCNAKLEKWEASMQDYRILIEEAPGDEEVSMALSEAQAKAMSKKRHQGEDAGNTVSS